MYTAAVYACRPTQQQLQL